LIITTWKICRFINLPLSWFALPRQPLHRLRGFTRKFQYRGNYAGLGARITFFQVFHASGG
jgi:hypothetical protein